MKHNFVVTLFLFVVAMLNAQQERPLTCQQKFVHVNEYNKLVLIELLEPGMTLYGISRKYNVSIDLIFSSNPDLKPHAIPLGYPVNIPVDPAWISFDGPKAGSTISLSYKVQPKETLYHISKTYLNTSPDQIIKLNPLAANGLSIGQVLNIGWLIPSGKMNVGIPAGIDSSGLVAKDYISDALLKGNVVKIQKGVAVWKPGNLSANYYVLHPTAKVGSMMEITNLMLHRTITAKVAGHIPPGLYQSHVGIVVSPSTARALGVLDQQFFARWRYVE